MFTTPMQYERYCKARDRKIRLSILVGILQMVAILVAFWGVMELAYKFSSII